MAIGHLAKLENIQSKYFHSLKAAHTSIDYHVFSLMWKSEMDSYIVSGQILKKLFKYSKQLRASAEQYKVILWQTDRKIQSWQVLRELL